MDQDFGVDSEKLNSLMNEVNAQKAKVMSALENIQTITSSFEANSVWKGAQSTLATTEINNLLTDALKVKEVFEAFYRALDTTRKDTITLQNKISAATNSLGVSIH